jgi:glyoxylase-like metal-dependent hydrolase (beta-lactamase superfamily II)
MVGAAATGAAAAWSGISGAPVHAAAPAVGKQVAGWYRYKLGSFEVTAITDGIRPTKIPDTFVRGVSREALNQGLASVYLDKENPAFPFTPIVVNTGSKLVAFDTGLGAGAFEQSKGSMGQFQTNLAASGIDRNAIDAVVISHFHADHINGLLMVDNKPAFPNAEILVPAAEWKFWTDEGELSRAPEGIKGNFANTKRVFGALGNKVTQYEAGKEIAPSVTAIAAPGHTPGHTAFMISSGSASLLHSVDTVAGTGTLFIRNPDWQVFFDMDGGVAVQTRRKLLDQAAADKVLFASYHVPFPAVGYIEKDGNGFRFVPAPWNPVI